MFFGFRNIEDKEAVLKEVKRVLKNGGQFVHLDFGNGNFLTDFIFEKFTSFIAKICSKNAASYKYLIISIKSIFKPLGLIKFMADRGFICHREYNFLFSTINVQIFKNKIF